MCIARAFLNVAACADHLLYGGIFVMAVSRGSRVIGKRHEAHRGIVIALIGSLRALNVSVVVAGRAEAAIARSSGIC